MVTFKTMLRAKRKDYDLDQMEADEIVVLCGEIGDELRSIAKRFDSADLQQDRAMLETRLTPFA